jgi:SepF-like predicted cell division protein (DUF552 family)
VLRAQEIAQILSKDNYNEYIGVVRANPDKDVNTLVQLILDGWIFIIDQVPSKSNMKCWRFDNIYN